MNPVWRLLQRIADKYGPQPAPSAAPGPAPVPDGELGVLCGLLRKFEGLRLEAYLCAGGVWTIGYGATRTLGGRPILEGSVITEDKADKLLHRDAKRVLRRMTKALRKDASSGARIAFASLAFNMGWPRIVESEALRFYNKGDLAEAERHFRQWRKAAGAVLPGLERRRAAEWRLVRAAEGNG